MIAARYWPEVAWTVARTWGFRAGAQRALHEARKLTGAFRAGPRHPLASAQPGTGTLFAVDAERLRAGIDVTAARTRADRVAAGAYEAFGWQWFALPSDAAEWRRHPGTGAQFDLSPWWTVPHLSPELGDIKVLWEPARFSWVYDLIRGYVVTGSATYADAFHRNLRTWVDSSPPFAGPHWSCGQETGIRAIALLHAEANLPAGAEERARCLQVLGWSGERVADAVGYAESQRNNHSLSEAAALLALGHRLRGMHPEAERWGSLGRAVFERGVRTQFEEDGWYIQHSFNYARVALDQSVVALRVLDAQGVPLAPALRARLTAAVRLLTLVMDPATGEVPNHGANDGARVLPLALAPFTDFRPTLTAAAALLRIPLAAGIEPDRETLAWLRLPLMASTASIVDGVYRGAGWAVARSRGTQVFLRAGRYRSRPSHLDPLQLDIRIAGRPLVVDAGSYLYNGPPPWRNGLASAAVHNGPMLDGREPGMRGPRFLWIRWPASRIAGAGWDGTTATLSAVAPGISRTVRVEADGVEVRDRVVAEGSGEVRVRWLLHPLADPAAVDVAGGGVVGEGREGATVGWYSAHYGERISTRYVEIARPAHAGAELVTRFGARSPAAT